MTSGAEWLDPIGDEATDRDAGAVQAALLTTYDPPDATLLVEDLLPRWFQLDRELSSDDAANRFFLAELEMALQRRRGKLAVFSSPAVLGPDSQHWIWSHVARHFVGARGSVVQHAKLWLLHRIDEDGTERLDIHVSSMNLTRSAVREQLQAGFRCLVRLGTNTSEAALHSWGAVGPFLQELGLHAGPAGREAVKPWLRLLARCRCPAGMTFIASVPGIHRGNDWGVRALGAALRLPARGEVDILVPTIGVWTKEQIESWAEAVGTLPKRINLAWIPKGHQWAKRWDLPATVLAAFKDSGARILALGDVDGDERQRLHRRFGAYDERWPHAKVYWFERGKVPRVLVTSANWSPSAWGIPAGRSRLYIKNFELGVLMPARKRPLRTLKEMTAKPAVVDATRDIDGTVPWAHAMFDGQRLTVQIIKGEVAPSQIEVIDADGHKLKLKVHWKAVDRLRRTVLNRAWKTGPSVVVLVLRAAEYWLSVQDLRDPKTSQEHPLSRPPGMDEDELKRLRAALLEERYGGKLIDDNEPSPSGGSSSTELTRNAVTPVADYSVWLLDEARHVLAVVDAWVEAFSKMQSSDLRDAIERDGRQLLQLWKKEASNGSRRKSALVVACDELNARLRSIA